MADTTVPFNATFGLAAGAESTAIILEDATIKPNISQTYIALQNFAGGISAAGGITLSGTIAFNGQTFTNVVQSVNGSTGAVGSVTSYPGISTGNAVYTYPNGVTTYNSGKQVFYQPVYSIIDTGAFTVYANRTYFSLFNATKSTTIKTIQIVPSNTGVTGNCYLSIYDADPTTGYPRTRLWSSSSIAVGSGYTKTTATNVNYTVSAGNFYLAASFSSTPTMYGYQKTYSLPIWGSPDFTSGYRNYYPVADTNGFTAPSSIPLSGVTFAFVDYVSANYSGVRIEYAV
jgi:hypothetical protein